jgi:hypothetical protein
MGLVKTEKDKKEREKKRGEERRQKELEERKRLEEERGKELERKRQYGEEERLREKKGEEKRKAQEKTSKIKLIEDKRKERGKKVFNFFHSMGLVKTEKDKKEREKKRGEERRQKELEERKRLEAERGKELERNLEKERKESEREEQKKRPVLGEGDLELSKELKEIEKLALKPAKEKIKSKEIPKFAFPEAEKGAGKSEEVAEDEIQKAISSMSIKKKPSILKGLFRKKEKYEDARKATDSFDLSGTSYAGKIELPEVMPKTYDKIDHVVLIEEKIHKIRSFLMDFKFDEAKKVYIEIMGMYNNLEAKKKAKVYKDIQEVYYERKSAEKFSK